MSKRKKFVIASFLLSLGLLSTQFVTVEFVYRYLAILGLFIVGYLISAWALFEDLKGVEWLVLVPMPGIFAASVALFYFLLPSAMWSRAIIFLLFGLGAYALYLTSNIYSVAAIRTIQLLRAAHAVGFLLILITSLLLYNSIFSFRFPFYVNWLMVFVVTVPLMVNGLWSIKLEPTLSKKILGYSFASALVMSELAVALSFWPVSVWIASLFLVAGVYVMLGLLQHHMQDRLFRKTFRDYISVGVFVFLVTMFVTRWR